MQHMLNGWINLAKGIQFKNAFILLVSDV